ncbi:hypothetical protein LMG27198_40090 [Methylocystis echinoides]|uniref:Uncharacterized protein n=1 Tax=Methylocystis echinoides TaxID=29468 RepID=A0A9W6LTZ9_9HYPH|nr:hypothetical protein LMG27198_40090 [Methylocystis echinoides]
MTIFDDARVSTGGKGVDAQVAALRAAGAEKVSKEPVNGASSDRAQRRPRVGEGPAATPPPSPPVR